MADISNYYSDTIITGTAEDDSIYNGGSNVTIEALAGNDSISNDYEASNVSISTGAGNDPISNYGVNVTADGGDGDDYFYEYGYGTAYVYSGGNDTLAYFNDVGTLVLGDVSIQSSIQAYYLGPITLNLSNGNSIVLNHYNPNTSSSEIHTVASVSEVEPINVVRNYD